ncbi:MAG: tetratricopeptide repeat protein [Phycisphaeraceae bacterium]
MLHPLRSFVYVLLLFAVVSVGCKAGQRTSPKAAAAPVIPVQAQVRAEKLTEQGKELKKEGFTSQALKSFSEAVEENPQLTEAHLAIGDIFRERGVYEDADAAYRKAVVSDPNNFDARYLLGLTNHLRGDLARAISSYKRALVINKDSYEANRDMGSAVMQSGKPKEAIKYAKRAAELSPESQAAWANLAAAYSLTGDYENAVQAYRQTLELGDAAIPILLGLADAHLKLGNFQRAENVLHAIEREGGDPIAKERMGLVLFKQRKFAAAVEAYRRALEGQPNDTAAMNGLGISLMAIYLRDGEEDDKLRLEALGLWRRSLNLRPNQGTLIDLLSRYTQE